MKSIRLSITICGERFKYITPQDLVCRLQERIKEIDRQLVELVRLKELRRALEQTLKQYTTAQEGDAGQSGGGGGGGSIER